MVIWVVIGVTHSNHGWRDILYRTWAKSHGASVSKVSHVYGEEINRIWLVAGIPSFVLCLLNKMVAKCVVPNWFVKPGVLTLTPAFEG